MLLRKIILSICINALIIGFMGVANAVPFSDLVDWDHQIKKGRTASMVFNKNGPFGLIHEDIILGEGISITDPVLTISHMGNVATKKNKREVWLLSDSGEICIGKLVTSNRRWKDQQFSLPPSLVEGLVDGSLSIELRSNRKAGSLWLDQSQLTFNYDIIAAPSANDGASSVPEPAAMLLLGVGMVTIAGFKKSYLKRR